MEKCNYCETTIIFGGIKDNNLIFCNKKCHEKSHLLLASRQIPNHIIEEQARKIHIGLCPKCKGAGPIDVHTSYRVYSIITQTSWQNLQNVCCRSCGIKKQIWDIIFSLTFGWWGFPWGYIMTPVQINRNIVAIFKYPNKLKPSEKLYNVVRVSLASDIINNQNIIKKA